jgi:ATP adenylyltransferase
MTLTRRALGALRKSFGPDGFNVGINQGKVAGAGFDDHVHQHVVPRWEGDTNFMPVVGSTRVISQALVDAYRELSAAFADT